MLAVHSQPLQSQSVMNALATLKFFTQSCTQLCPRRYLCTDSNLVNIACSQIDVVYEMSHDAGEASLTSIMFQCFVGFFWCVCSQLVFDAGN
jgi:hypothetical protein